MGRLTSPEELVCDPHHCAKEGAGISGTSADISSGIESVNGSDGSFVKRR